MDEVLSRDGWAWDHRSIGTRLETNLIGVAGEYLVAAELSRRGWIANVTLKNARGVDILAFMPPPGPGSIAIQTKTTGGPHWVLPKHDPDKVRAASEFIVLVQLREIETSSRADFYVMPAELMDRVVAWHENNYTTRNGRRPTMNTINPGWVSRFGGAWELLLGAGGAEERLDDRYRS